ncbi:OmpA family protein [Notoacmeibacter sp. MSK16QG-6]|uniref:OmpA family protein n=1 Tax=Notoacmeibacter sp. MSK16QG-6 TaxID=2957982 RepID=UPI00209DB33E|nr:OmpA family protein [Notoacmeibacter sp. MSK16QG-6]MCP1198965.1 OmpA family protein [Notoacmeibacter sp. MSK16QG-6]
MPLSMRHLVLAAAVFMAGPAMAQEATVVQPFAGSEYIAQHAVEFDRLTYLSKIEDGETETDAIEGTLRVGVLKWPEGKAPLEIQRSFENALNAAGFEIMANADLPQFSPEQKALQAVFKTNRLGGRGYPRIDNPKRNAGLMVQKVDIFPAHYISAKRSKDGEDTVFTLIMSSQARVYMMEEATAAAMAEDTVSISAEGLTSEIEEAGKAILYGVQFDTGSAIIRPSSAASLEVIAEVLKSRDGGFYIVGHTDDTGGFEMNMTLSSDRSASIVKALIDQYGIDASRLQSGGVGPLAPLASNENEAGRQLNRRVELVERLEE